MKKLQWSVIVLGIFCVVGMIWLGSQAVNFDDVRQEQYIRIIFVFLFSAFSLFTIAYLCGKIKNKRHMHSVISIVAVMSFVLIFPYAITPDRTSFAYSYESSDGIFSVCEHLGGKSEFDKPIEFSDIKRRFAEYVKKTDRKDIVLCRTFKKDDRIRWFHFYTWLRYNTQERWQLPYKTTEKVFRKDCLEYEYIYFDKKHVATLHYDEKGNINRKVKYKNNKRIGDDHFYKNGKLIHRGSFVNGAREGITTSYYVDGKIAVKINYKNNRKHGKAISFYPNGAKFSDFGYKSQKEDPDHPDFLDGDFIIYDMKGKIISHGIFKRGFPWDGTFLSSSKSCVQADIILSTTLEYKLQYKDGKFIKASMLNEPFNIDNRPYPYIASLYPDPNQD